MDYSTIGTPMGNHECNFVEEQEPDGRLILGPCIECGLPAAEAIKEFSTTKELLKETQDNRNDAWKKVSQLEAENAALISDAAEMKPIYGKLQENLDTANREIERLKSALAERAEGK